MSDHFNAFLVHSQTPIDHAVVGPLAGLTMAVKDIFDIAGQRTGGGNPQMLTESKPAAKTAPSVRDLIDAGARFVGRTQTDELTFSLMGQNAHYPQPVNPSAPGRVTGGSSSGSAAAVAGGLADIALGSDTGGSIRAPAGFCGLIGLRTTHGAISLEGAMPLAPSLDTFGWFARDIDIYKKVGETLIGETSQPLRCRKPFRVAALDGLLLGRLEADAYGRMLSIAAVVLGEISNIQDLAHSIDDLYWSFRRIQAHEAWATHGDWISAKERGLGPGVKERFEFGATIERAAYDVETARREAFRLELAELLGDDGILVLPTVPGAAPLRDAVFDDLQAYRERALRLLCISGLSGFPQISLPIGTVDDAPFGISLLGPAGSDMALIELGRDILEASRGR